jgi:hypothetical protein
MSRLTFSQLINKYYNNEIDISETVESLKSFVENSDDDNVRIEAIRIFGDISPNSDHNFKFLENLTISDKNPFMRSEALKFLVDKYPEECLDLLKWIYENDKSPIITFNLISSLEHLPKDFCEDLRDAIRIKYFDNYIQMGVNPNDASVLGILEVLIGYQLGFKKIDYDEYYRILEDSFENLDFKINKEGFVTGLYIGNLGPEGLSFIPKQIYKLKYLREVDFSNNIIDEIPESINRLKDLEFLDLSRNKIRKIPESVGDIKSLIFLDISLNEISQIPKSLLSIKSLKYLELRGNKELLPSKGLYLMFEDPKIFEKVKRRLKKSEYRFFNYWGTNHTCGGEIGDYYPPTLVCPKCNIELKLWKYGISF